MIPGFAGMTTLYSFPNPESRIPNPNSQIPIPGFLTPRALAHYSGAAADRTSVARFFMGHTR